MALLFEDIKKTYKNHKESNSSIIKIKSLTKLKGLVAEYELITRFIEKCKYCSMSLFQERSKKELAYSCSNGVEVYVEINKCLCGKFNIVSQERKGDCTGMCTNCDLQMVVKFPIKHEG